MRYKPSFSHKRDAAAASFLKAQDDVSRHPTPYNYFSVLKHNLLLQVLYCLVWYLLYRVELINTVPFFFLNSIYIVQNL